VTVVELRVGVELCVGVDVRDAIERDALDLRAGVERPLAVDPSSRDLDIGSHSDVTPRAGSPSEIVGHFYLGCRR